MLYKEISMIIVCLVISNYILICWEMLYYAIIRDFDYAGVISITRWSQLQGDPNCMPILIAICS